MQLLTRVTGDPFSRRPPLMRPVCGRKGRGFRPADLHAKDCSHKDEPES